VGIEHIALAMQNMNQATLQTLASTHQTEESGQNLNALAGNLTATVSLYRV
jgi:methyl-accepting chemotaxis protein